MKTAMQELLEYIKTADTFTFLPEQLAKTIEEKYLPKEKAQIADAFRNGSTSSMLGGGHWTQYYNKTYKS